MKSFQDYISDDPDTLDEAFLRGASAALLMNHIHSQRKKIKRTGKVTAQTLDSLASMILASASLTFAMTQLPPEKIKGKK